MPPYSCVAARLSVISFGRSKLNIESELNMSVSFLVDRMKYLSALYAGAVPLKKFIMVYPDLCLEPLIQPWVGYQEH